MKNKISAVLIVRNEEKKIKKCLESIKWCDEIIVVDQSSTDNTLQIAKQYTDKIFITENKLYCEPDREFAISKASNDWILLTEADEIITEELKKEIIGILNLKYSKDVYYVPRKNFFLGKWIEGCGWYPSFVPRVFKKGFVRFSVKIHHDGEILTKNIGYLKNDILHYSYDSIDDWIDKFKRYTTILSKEYYQANMKFSFLNSLRELLIRPIYFFVLKYFILKGFKDGWRGFFISLSSALTIIFAYFKLIELYEKNSN